MRSDLLDKTFLLDAVSLQFVGTQTAAVSFVCEDTNCGGMVIITVCGDTNRGGRVCLWGHRQEQSFWFVTITKRKMSLEKSGFPCISFNFAVCFRNNSYECKS